jgi:type IX secretion system PorP/SprF family membrane protein
MRKYNYIFTAFLLLSIPVAIIAQQEAQYTQYAYNKMLVNPGFAGSRRIPSVTALYRNQWMGFDGHPVSFLGSFDAPFKETRVGLGLTVAHQKDGIFNRNFANLAFNYAIINTDEMTLRAGMSANVKRYRFDLNDPEVYIKNPNDAILMQDKPTVLNGNVGTGLYFDMDAFYVGLSCPNLIKNPIVLNKNKTNNPNSVEQRHAYLQAGGFFRMGTERLHLKPTMLLKYVKNAPMSADLNIGVMLDRTFLIGGGYRTGDSDLKSKNAFNVMSFYQVNDELGIGAAYDFSLNQIKSASAGSAEVLIRYDIIKGKKTWHNPRFFF